MIKITLAMPVYNVGEKVRFSLLSALNQTYQNLEILVIDDKGTDRSMDIVEEIRATHPRGNIVRIIDHINNQGIGATRNSAIDNAQGDYLYFMDSDDIIRHDTIEILYKKALETGVEIVAASHIVCDEKMRAKSFYTLPDVERKTISLFDYTIKGNGGWTPYTWNKLYSMKYLRENGLRCIPHHLCEDMFFTFQVKLTCHSFASISDYTYAYIENPNSVMGKGFNKKLIEQCFEVLNAQERYLQMHHVANKDDEVYNHIEYVSSCIYFIDAMENSTRLLYDEKKCYRKRIITILEHYCEKYQFKFMNEMNAAIEKYSLFNSTSGLDGLLVMLQKQKINSLKLNEKISYLFQRIKRRFLLSIHYTFKYQ